MSDLQYSDSIVIGRPANELYDMVSDVTRMGEWSPVCRACWWDEGAGPRPGAWFTRRNETPERTWETRPVVEVAEPAREFAFLVNGGWVRWGYTFDPDDAWTTIRYPRAVFDEQLGQWVSDAEIAEVPFTAFTSKPKAKQVTARLVVRRVRDQHPDHLVPVDQGERFPAWRYHAVFTDSPLVLLQAEADQRRHAIIEQVIADLKSGPLAHLPSGRFNANGAWLALATIAFNLTRTAGVLASHSHARASTATRRTQLINIPAKPVRLARRVHLRLPTDWPWADDWLDLFTAATGPSTPVAA